jgi:hypothetical protein
MAHARAVIEEAFPGLIAVFGGRAGTVAPRIRTISFRLRDEMGKYHSNVVWLMPEGILSLTPDEVRELVRRSNGGS